MSDTRIQQALADAEEAHKYIGRAKACIDDARTLLADMSEDGYVSTQLDVARLSANVLVAQLQILARVEGN